MSDELRQQLDTKNRPAGKERKAETENKEPVLQILFKQPSTPLFISESSEGAQGNAQDEKDEAAE